MQLLLISNGNDTEHGYLGHALPHLDELLGDVKDIVFVPYAVVTRSFDDYTELVATALGDQRSVVGLHRTDDPRKTIHHAGAILVGGGNTWQLLRTLRDLDLLAPIRDAVRSGTAYAGWSAGSNVACPTISTTNDMPIVDPTPHIIFRAPRDGTHLEVYLLTLVSSWIRPLSAAAMNAR